MRAIITILVGFGLGGCHLDEAEIPGGDPVIPADVSAPPMPAEVAKVSKALAGFSFNDCSSEGSSPGWPAPYYAQFWDGGYNPATDEFYGYCIQFKCDVHGTAWPYTSDVQNLHGIHVFPSWAHWGDRIRAVVTGTKCSVTLYPHVYFGGSPAQHIFQDYIWHINPIYSSMVLIPHP
jgi:hypothetical protein